MTADNRPLSPHLQIYKPQINSILSILHRATGFALAAGVLAFTYWLYALVHGDTCFNCVVTLSQTLVGKVVLGGWLFSFIYHALNGIRHLIWDMGYGLTIKSNYVSGILIVIATAVLTYCIWMGA